MRPEEEEEGGQGELEQVEQEDVVMGEGIEDAGAANHLQVLEGSGIRMVAHSRKRLQPMPLAMQGLELR